LPESFLAGKGTWSDEAHVSFEDVEKLRKLVQTPFANEPAYGGYAWVVGHLERGSLAFVEDPKFVLQFISVFHHGTELIECKGLSTVTAPLLAEQNWAWRHEFDGGRNREHYGG
jgi:hypothetical protein